MLDGISVVGLNGFDCEMASGASVAGIKKLMSEEIIKKDDTVVGILTGRLKDAMIPVDYHNNSENTFANPPKNQPQFINEKLYKTEEFKSMNC